VKSWGLRPRGRDRGPRVWRAQSGYPSTMAKSADPKRIYIARRAGLAARLVSVARISPESAEHWVTQWEAEAARRGIDGHSELWWRPAWEWIAEQRHG
jgi:hypothetical protein